MPGEHVCGKPYRGFESHPLREMFFAYILHSLKDGSFYYGSSGNLENRLAEHNAGKVRSTKGRRPFEIHYSERFATRREALRREKFFKTIAGYRRLKEQGMIGREVGRGFSLKRPPVS